MLSSFEWVGVFMLNEGIITKGFGLILSILIDKEIDKETLGTRLRC